MRKKIYNTKKNKCDIASEPVTDYKKKKADTSREWNPNIPFHGTQEEWWEHFHDLEKGSFYAIDEADKEFEEWKKELLAGRTEYSFLS